MKREELKRLWRRSQKDQKFRHLFLSLLRTLVWLPSSARDRIAACTLADHVLARAGVPGRRQLQRRLKAAGCEF